MTIKSTKPTSPKTTGTTDGGTTRIAYTACPLDCPDLCSLEVTVDGGRISKIGATRANPLTDGYLCSKVRGFADHVYHETRLTSPLVRTGAKGAAKFRDASWDEALDMIATRLLAAKAEHGGDAILPLAYGGSNGLLTDHATDDLFFARLGACLLERTVCAAPTGMASMGLYGKMQGVAYEDYVHARLIVVWGTNPHATGIHVVPHIKRARAAGAKLVVIDPRRTPLARSADLHLPLRPGTDLCVALAVVHHLFETGAADEAFLAKQTTGVDALRARAAAWTIEGAAAEAGLATEDLRRFAELYAASAPAVIRCGWGLERNRNGGSAACAVMALPAIGGKFGVRGGGFTMSNGGTWDLKPPVRNADGFGRAINMNRVGRALCELNDPPIKALFVYNANPLMTLPNQRRVREGLEREDLFTVVFDQVMTDTARYADVVLPATTFLEHTELRKGYGAPMMSLGKPAIDPVGESRPNYDVFMDLAKRVGVWTDTDPATPEELCAAALEGSPELWSTLEEKGFASLAIEAPIQFVDVQPGTPDGLVHLCPDWLEEQTPAGLYTYQPDPTTERFPLALISPALARLISSSLGELHTDEVPLDLHPDDAAERGLKDGDLVRAWNEFGEVVTRLRVTDEMRPGTACLPKGIWSHNTRNGDTSNSLSPDSLADLGKGACFNDARIEVAAQNG